MESAKKHVQTCGFNQQIWVLKKRQTGWTGSDEWKILGYLRKHV